MNRYENGKIYKIVDVGYNKCYIGSTTERLSKRFERHREHYRKRDQDNRKTSAFDLFDEFDVENCKIELIENYPCENKEELLRREGHHIKLNDCVNKYVAGRTRKEYYNDNQERLLTEKKQYRQDNIEMLKEKDKKYHHEHKEQRNEYCKKWYEENKQEQLQKHREYIEQNKEAMKRMWKQYYEENKEAIRQKRKVKQKCECGGHYTRDNRAQHYKTKKHTKFINELNSQAHLQKQTEQ